MNFVQIIILILLACIFILVFGIQYLKSRENMALIEKNLAGDDQIGKSNFLFVCGVTLIGISIGFIVGAILDSIIGERTNLSYVISLLFFSGISFIVSYYLTKRQK